MYKLLDLTNPKHSFLKNNRNWYQVESISSGGSPLAPGFTVLLWRSRPVKQKSNSINSASGSGNGGSVGDSTITSTIIISCCWSSSVVVVSQRQCL